MRSYILENGMIRLQFERASIDVSPAEAQALVSDSRLHNEIRRAVLAARQQIRPFVGEPKERKSL